MLLPPIFLANGPASADNGDIKAGRKRPEPLPAGFSFFDNLTSPFGYALNKTGHRIMQLVLKFSF